MSSGGEAGLRLGRRMGGSGRGRIHAPVMLALLPFALPAAARGQASDSCLTISAAAGAALVASPAVRAADASARGARASVGEARSAWLPAVMLEANATRFAEPMVVAPLHGFDPRQPPSFDRTLIRGNATVAWTVFDGGARSARIRHAEALAAASDESAEAAAAALLAETVRAYLGVRTARDVQDAAVRRVVALGAERRRSEQLFDQGRAARVAVLRADAALARARADSASAAADVDTAERELARLTGMEATAMHGAMLDSVSVPPALPERAALMERARAASPALESMRGRQLAAEAAHAEARAAWLPTIRATGGYIEYASAGTTSTGEWQGGVALTYPVFSGGRRLHNAERAAAEADAATARVHEAALGVERSLDRAYAALESARARVSALEVAERESAEVVRIELLALSAGAGTQTDYLSAETDLFEARAARTRARSATIDARVELARITGALSLEWIHGNLERGR